MNRVVRIVVVLLVVWAVAAGVMFWMRGLRPTPASLQAYIEKHPLASLSEPAREDVIRGVADRLNRLNFDERQELRRGGSDRKFFDQLTPEERKKFIEMTMPEGFRQFMLALNKMDPERRKRIVKRALENLEKDNPEISQRLQEDEVRKIVNQGMSSFYEEANADVKLDFAPVIEQLQRAAQRP